MAKNLSIVAEGISGDEGHLLGHNISDNGIYTPAIGDVVRGTSATYVAQDGTLKTAKPNVARVDYTNGVAELLLEPTSTNLVTYSEDFSQSAWVNGSTFTNQNYGISPSGENDASRLLFTNSSQSVYTSTTATGKIVGSLYVKGVFGETIQLFVGGAETQFTLNGEWQRLSLKNPSSVNGFLNINTNGGSTARDLMIWGAQIEQITEVTSYISTNGATASRSADTITNFGSSQIIDSQSGILFFKGSFFDNGLRRLSLRNDSNATLIYISSNSGQVQSVYFSQATNSSIITTNTDAVSKSVKIAFKYRSNDFSLWVDGVKVGEDLSGQADGSATSFSFYDNSVYFYGRVRQVKHLPYNTDISTL